MQPRYYLRGNGKYDGRWEVCDRQTGGCAGLMWGTRARIEMGKLRDKLNEANGVSRWPAK